ncbi:hypothetical protein BKA70DRAFT_1252346 [Coprinopsis sp. MPI-PUGE-AT-0042]|nr:hypothetical protein BKA70DRAFT_1252346 [Coprinopsis sp. MPI-PUGE-AT-0042]
MPDIRDAVRDTVAYRHQPEQQRTRPSRSQTTTTPTAKSSTTRRSHSQDSANNISEKPRSGAKATRPKKGSKHADVIDRLDFTGVGPMFHHDGPFDACAPSRNKYTTKAPMSTWGTRPEELRQGTGGGGAYPAYPTGLFTEEHPEPPKKKVDAIAEAWGIHEPEPFEEFFAGGGGKSETPASSIYGGRTGHASQRVESREGRSRAPVATRRTAVPPPQPIFVPEAEDGVDQPIAGSPPAGSGPKRSKSLMHRIRRMRDAPNVPVSDYDTQPPPSPSTPTGATYESQPSRPTHRSQNSFLGRFGVKSANPSAPSNAPHEPEPYIYIDNQNDKDKALPATPMDRSMSDTSPRLGYSNYNSDNTQQLGRKTSLMKKVGRVVRGGR